ncbi:Acyl-coenzyme A thioesterase 13 [Hypsizygus marmoreus]|uniref:Acyl-coenzyme A thioesterase 13 n=1 Tax=Hypsizygus marmoreus TaxID=39966 RepID=A0A369JKM6_HYPMA|nr:Acyl-coenzyme A thioesterase 13 [Hypsizygus marmoreus]
MSSEAAQAILQTWFPDKVISQISGNASPEIKQLPLRWLAVFHGRKGSFANSISSRVKVVEVSVIRNPEDPRKTEGRVVCEIDVTEDMLNGSGVMHEGCSVFLIDECSVCSLVTLNAAEGRDSRPGVSQAINTVFHHPAKLGAKLRIVNTSMMAGVEMTSCRSEIWDVGNHRLVASGVQLQMSPSKPLNYT